LPTIVIVGEGFVDNGKIGGADFPGNMLDERSSKKKWVRAMPVTKSRAT
jgi:hypothetical protein